VIFVKKGILVLLALVLALRAGFACSMAQAEAAVKAPCCGPTCPVPSSAADRTCCQQQGSGSLAEALTAKPEVPSSQPLIGLIHPHVVVPALNVLGRETLLQSSLPGAAKLALLCSRQI
jgi:hypothetical protein